MIRMEAMQEKLITNEFMYKELLIEDNKYVIGVRQLSTGRQVILTDLITFYEETLSTQDIIQRCEDLNPVLMDFDWVEIVDSLLVDIPKYVVTCNLHNIELKTKIEDGNFFFKIQLAKTSSQNFHDGIVKSFCTSFLELHNRYNSLVSIVKKKDEEIAEYKAQGIELLRKSLITEPFDETKFIDTLKGQKSLDDMSIFLDAMRLCQFVTLSQKQAKAEGISVSTNSKIDQEDELSLLSKSSRKKSVRRPASSRVRCAVPPKVIGKIKIPKKSSSIDCL